MARTIGDVLIRIGATTNQLEYDLKKAEKSLRASAQRMQTISTNLTVGLSVPLAAAGASALKSFASYEKLEKGLTAVMGSAEAAGKELQLLKEAAKAPGLGFEEAVRGSIRLQAVGLSAEEARKTLSTFGAAIAATGGSAQNLDSVQYQLTQMISKNRILQEDFGILQENVPLLGKAVEAAFGTANIEKIRATGISAEEFNRRIVESLQNLPEVQKATGGLGNAFDNFSDSIKFSLVELGRIIAESINLQKVLDTVAGFIEGIVDGFKSLNPELQKAIVIFAGIAAAIGPVLFVTSQLNLAYGTLLINIIKVADKFKNGGFLAGFTALSGPAIVAIGAVAAAIYLIYTNWETVKKSMVDVANYFIEIYNESLIVRAGVDGIVKSIKLMYSYFKFAISSMIDLFKGLLKAGVIVFKGIGLAIKGVLTFNPDDIKNAFANTWAELSKNSVSTLKDLKGDLKTFGEDVVSGWQDTSKKISYISLTPDQKKSGSNITGASGGNGGGGAGPGTKPKFEIDVTNLGEFNDTIVELNTQLAKTRSNLRDGFITEAQYLEIAIENTNARLQELINQGFGPTDKEVINVSNQLAMLTERQNDLTNASQIYLQTLGLMPGKFNLLNETVTKTEENFKNIVKIMGAVPGSMISIGNIVSGVGEKVQSSFTDIFDFLNEKFGEGTGKLASDIAGAVGTAFNTLGSIYNLQAANLDAYEEKQRKVIENTITNEDAKAAAIAKLEEDLAKKRAQLARKKAIADKAAAIFSATIAGATEVVKVLGNPILAGVVAGLVAAQIAAIAATPLPSLAIGTNMVKSDGMAMLHKGEAVVPADVVGGGFSRGGGELYGRLSGIDLLLSNRYAEGYYKRIR
jgi:tape measure domain-containing protein